MIKTYVRKPEPIQAIQWTGDNLEEIRRFIGYDKRDDRACCTDRLSDGTIDFDQFMRMLRGDIPTPAVCDMDLEIRERKRIFEQFVHGFEED